MNINPFNTSNSVLVITSYPSPHNGKYGKREFNAIAGHSERTLKELAKTHPLLICAEKLPDSPSFSPEKKMYVDRVWEKGKIQSFFSLFSYIVKLNKIKSIYVQFEFNVFGGVVPNLALLVTLLALRLFGKHITFELHQVILDIGSLEKHINIKNPFSKAFFNIGLRGFYRALGIVANKIIVFEEELKNRLKRYVKNTKIEVLALAEKERRTIPISRAKNILNIPQKEFVVLVFGFINGYKGIDWIIEKLQNEGKKNIRLLIAGGENPYLKDKAFYQKFYRSILYMASQHKHVTITGFVPDSKIYLYYSVADLVVMPYEVFMSASGPFSLALSFKKPIILSEKLEKYSQSLDFMKSMERADIKKTDLFFNLESDDVLELIHKAKRDTKFLQKLTTFSEALGYERSGRAITKRLENVLFAYDPAYYRPTFQNDVRFLLQS